mmetsp:Transcript_22577/g.41054  ORF Transcript_22577/g.41054 Transcript_22577/m.41054 type:complete len:84 (-) Transcript_22577:23-274(-)
MAADQQFLTRSAERSTAFRNKLGEKALQGFEHLMSEYATSFFNFVNFNGIGSNRRGGDLWCCNVSAYDMFESALPPSSTSNKV